MPTIELVAIRCPALPDFPRFRSFAIRSETALASHRGLFQPEFDQVSGVIVHLANKDCESDPDGFWFGSDLVEWDDGDLQLPVYESTADLNAEDQWHGEDQLDRFRFKPPVADELRTLIVILLESSPEREVWFTTDMQFGPSIKTQATVSLSEFLDLIHSTELRWHCLYRIRESWVGCRPFPLSLRD